MPTTIYDVPFTAPPGGSNPGPTQTFVQTVSLPTAFHVGDSLTLTADLAMSGFGSDVVGVSFYTWNDATHLRTLIATSSNTVDLPLLSFQTFSFSATVSTAVQPTEIAYVLKPAPQGSASMILAVDGSNPYAGGTVYVTDIGVTGSYFTAQSEDAYGTLTVTPSPVAEPSSAAMLCGTMLCLALARVSALMIKRAIASYLQATA